MKGLDYVAIDRGIAKDPKITAMARALKKDRRWVAGCFPEFFGNVAEHAPDGCLVAISDDDLDTWAGDVAGFGVLVRRLLCDEAGVLTAWWRYNGQALAKLQKNRDRVNDYRRTVREQNANSTRTVTPKTAHANAHSTGLTVTDTVTVTDTGTTPTPTAASSARVEAFLVDARATRFAEQFESAVRSAKDPETLVQEFQALRQGMNSIGGVAVPLDVIGQAVSDMRLNGDQLTARRLRVFCGNLMKPSALAPRGARQTPGRASPGDEVLAAAARLTREGEL